MKRGESKDTIKVRIRPPKNIKALIRLQESVDKPVDTTTYMGGKLD
jgi:hypothetical protein